MLGSEYHWLISVTRPAEGAPKITLVRTGAFALSFAVFCFLCLALQAEPAHVTLIKEAGAATATGNLSAAIAKLEAARSLRPGYPRILIQLARSYAAANRSDDALAQLSELAAMGLSSDFSQDPAFNALRSQPKFLAVTRAMAANNSPVGIATPTITLPSLDGIIEGLATHPKTHALYFSDVRNRCIWVRETSQTHLRKFSSDVDQLTGIFGLKIDEARNVLWAGTAALPEMKNYTAADQGRAALVEFDLTSGRILRSFAVPRDGHNHVLGDLALSPDGGVFVPDSLAPLIWHLAPDGTALEKWLESDDFISLQGVSLTDDGKTLVVSDYANGLWRNDCAGRSKTLLTAPAHTTLFGIDGIYAISGGLVAIQNGITPQRIIRIDLDSSSKTAALRTLQSGHSGMDDLALGQVIDGRFEFIGNSGWGLYENKTNPPAARDVLIFATPL